MEDFRLPHKENSADKWIRQVRYGYVLPEHNVYLIGRGEAGMQGKQYYVFRPPHHRRILQDLDEIPDLGETRNKYQNCAIHFRAMDLFHQNTDEILIYLLLI